jgi:hypothetical protein
MSYKGLWLKKDELMSLGIPIERGHVNIVENQNDSDDEVDVYIIELVWPNVKLYTSSDLKAVRKKTR